jgi:hypothetical protein
MTRPQCAARWRSWRRVVAWRPANELNEDLRMVERGWTYWIQELAVRRADRTLY